MGQLDLRVCLSPDVHLHILPFTILELFVCILSSFIVRWLGCLKNRFLVMQSAMADTLVDLCQYRRIRSEFMDPIIIDIAIILFTSTC